MWANIKVQQPRTLPTQGELTLTLRLFQGPSLYTQKDMGESRRLESLCQWYLHDHHCRKSKRTTLLPKPFSPMEQRPYLSCWERGIKPIDSGTQIQTYPRWEKSKRKKPLHLGEKQENSPSSGMGQKTLSHKRPATATGRVWLSR